MRDRVTPFASRTGNEHIPFGVSAETWNAMTPKERWKLNDGALRQRINAGDKVTYIGRDNTPDPIREANRKRFDLTGSEILRLQDRNVQVNQVPESVVQGTVRNPVDHEKR